MKTKNIKYVAAAMLLSLSMTSCEDFLDRPVEDNYNTENYYTDDASCIRGVNYLYNSPWNDFSRGLINVGEILSGNMYKVVIHTLTSPSMVQTKITFG